MALNLLSVGSVVVNFGQTARVVGFETRVGHPNAGWPILKGLGADGKPRGGKWAADPTKCEVAQ